MVMEADVVVKEVDNSTPSEIEQDPPAQPTKGKEKVLEIVPMPRFQSGSVSAKGSAFKDPEFAHALACSLQTPKDQEIMD